jgi:hypothetical protein
MWMLDITVLFMVEVADWEDRKSGKFGVPKATSKEKEGSQFTPKFSWHCIHHAERMEDHIKSEEVGHSLLSEICTRHMRHELPVQFH